MDNPLDPYELDGFDADEQGKEESETGRQAEAEVEADPDSLQITDLEAIVSTDRTLEATPIAAPYSPKLGATLANKQRWRDETWENTATDMTLLGHGESVRSRLKAVIGSSAPTARRGKKKPATLLTNKKQGAVGYFSIERLGTGPLG